MAWGSVVNWGKLSKARAFRFLSVSLRLQRPGRSFPPGMGRTPLSGGLSDLLQRKARESFLPLPPLNAFSWKYWLWQGLLWGSVSLLWRDGDEKCMRLGRGGAGAKSFLFRGRRSRYWLVPVNSEVAMSAQLSAHGKGRIGVREAGNLCDQLVRDLVKTWGSMWFFKMCDV